MSDQPTTELSLSDVQRDEILGTIDRDGCAVLPLSLPRDLIERADAYIEAYCARCRQRDPRQRFFIETNIVESDPVFRDFLTFMPALQLSYDVFGPMFHLGQDTWRAKWHEPDHDDALSDPGSISWHSDGPVWFPQFDGHCPLHSLRFGYFISDVLRDDAGSLEVIRGSHRKQVLHARASLRCVREPKRDDDFVTDHVAIRGEAGTVVVFHNAIWHQASPNKTHRPRKIVFFQYCPTFIRPIHREVPYPGDMSHFTDEQRWLLAEPREPTAWITGSETEWKRMARFRRDAKDDGFDERGPRPR